MKIRYEFVTGEVVEIEVADDIGDVSIAIDKEIYNGNRRETRRHNSVQDLEEQGRQLPDESNNVENEVIRGEVYERLHKAIAMLQPQQQKLVKKVFFEEQTMADIAREEGVTAKAIQDRVNKIKTRLRKILENNLF